MDRRTTLRANVLIGTLLSVMGWIVVYITVAPWWAITTASERAMSPIANLVSMVVATAPTLVYFLVVGAVFGHLLGRMEGSKLALLSAAAAMCIHALIAEIVFYGGIELFAVLTVAIYFVLPLLIAVAGAASAHIWRSPTPHGTAT